ncbi:MAG: energy-coupling factor ABC transporter substrate-binding protein [Methanomassiliicoccus sp.]|nr:energy-coupling factor ABC transporter substrate-binding protein [Methanomassiliicoccus sp.]
MSPKKWYVVGFALIIVICVSAFVFASHGEFGGSDDQGEDQILNIDPTYEPWFHSFWEPPAETESMLFALQAAIGAMIIGYFIGNERGKRTAKQKIAEASKVQEQAIRAEAIRK